MTVNKRAVRSVVQLFISFRGFVHSVFRSFVFADERSVDYLFVNSVKRHPLARLDVRSLGPVRLFVRLVVPPLAQFFLLSMGINMS